MSTNLSIKVFVPAGLCLDERGGALANILRSHFEAEYFFILANQEDVGKFKVPAYFRHQFDPCFVPIKADASGQIGPDSELTDGITLQDSLFLHTGRQIQQLGEPVAAPDQPIVTRSMFPTHMQVRNLKELQEIANRSQSWLRMDEAALQPSQHLNSPPDIPIIQPDITPSKLIIPHGLGADHDLSGPLISYLKKATAMDLNHLSVLDNVEKLDPCNAIVRDFKRLITQHYPIDGREKNQFTLPIDNLNQALMLTRGNLFDSMQGGTAACSADSKEPFVLHWNLPGESLSSVDDVADILKSDKVNSIEFTAAEIYEATVALTFADLEPVEPEMEKWSDAEELWD